MSKEASIKISKARAGLILDHPFFASIVLPMPMIEDPADETMSTDGESIRYNPKWVEGLTVKEITFVLAHEALHCMFDHMGRRGARGPNRWNQAADYIINDLLVKNKVGSMPHLGLLNPSLVKQGGGTAEGVYKLLPEEDEKKQSGQKGGALDKVHDSGTDNGTQPTDDAKIQEKSSQLKVRVAAARNAAKMYGNMPQDLDRLVDEMLEPVVDWRDVLRRFVTEKAKIDYSFSRPNRRFMSEDIIMPSASGQKMGKVFVGVDCSGSVSPKLLAEFASEIAAIREDVLPSSIEVIYFDSKVCGVEVFGPDDDFKLNLRGGGGTAFSPVFNYINKSEEDPVAVIMLTDLICHDFGRAPSYPVLWVCLSKLEKGFDKVPFGEIVIVK